MGQNVSIIQTASWFNIFKKLLKVDSCDQKDTKAAILNFLAWGHRLVQLQYDDYPVPVVGLINIKYVTRTLPVKSLGSPGNVLGFYLSLMLLFLFWLEPVSTLFYEGGTSA